MPKVRRRPTSCCCVPAGEHAGQSRRIRLTSHGLHPRRLAVSARDPDRGGHGQGTSIQRRKRLPLVNVHPLADLPTPRTFVQVLRRRRLAAGRTAPPRCQPAAWHMGRAFSCEALASNRSPGAVQTRFSASLVARSPGWASSRVLSDRPSLRGARFGVTRPTCRRFCSHSWNCCAVRRSRGYRAFRGRAAGVDLALCIRWAVTLADAAVVGNLAGAARNRDPQAALTRCWRRLQRQRQAAVGYSSLVHFPTRLRCAGQLRAAAQIVSGVVDLRT